jgi:hypothetical protein
MNGRGAVSGRLEMVAPKKSGEGRVQGGKPDGVCQNFMNTQAANRIGADINFLSLLNHVDCRSQLYRYMLSTQRTFSPLFLFREKKK